MITSEMRTLICENTIGLVATVTPGGKPAVSPKATSVVLSPSEIAFLDIRSPKTRQNIKANPNVELNYVDVYAVKPVDLPELLLTSVPILRNSQYYKTILENLIIY